MSFSGKVREELAGNISSARHCQIAELAAFIGLCGTIVFNRFDRCSIKIHSENFLVARKVYQKLNINLLSWKMEFQIPFPDSKIEATQRI